MSDRCFYDVLGVGRDADAKTLKSAYRKKVMALHPDRNPGDSAAEAEFKQVTEAYEILSDGEKRSLYDRFGKQAFNGSAGPNGAGAAGGHPEDILRDVFAEFFGASRAQRSNPRRGSDLRYDYEISLEEAFHGKTAEVSVPKTETCDDCEGSGAAPGSTPETCSGCQGSGRMRMQQGFFTMERTCSRCQGAGQVLRNPCRTCSGRGLVRRERKLQIPIPAGILDEQRIRLEGEGEPGPRNGPRGDLYIFVIVREHEIFERDGTTLYARAPVPVWTAALGGEIELPTIDGGRTRVTIPEGAETGKRLRLRGKGMPDVRGGPIGDLYVEIFVETPRDLSSRQRELMRQLAAEVAGGAPNEGGGFFKRVKRFFDSDDGRPG
ncbi:molecular chaperone DnaJ [bacterium]|nr:molecular chaperone DnaJ [bacterium]